MTFAARNVKVTSALPEDLVTAESTKILPRSLPDEKVVIVTLVPPFSRELIELAVTDVPSWAPLAVLLADVDHFKRQVDVLIRDIRGSERIPGVERIWLPGEQSQARRSAYLRDGIPIPAGLLQTLDKLAEQLKVPALRDTTP